MATDAAGRSPLAVPIAVALAGLAGLLAVQGSLNRHSIEDELTRASASALTSAGIAGARVTFTGRDAGIVVAGSSAEARRAKTVVEGVTGVRVATADVSGSGGAGQPGTLPPPDQVAPVPSEPGTTASPVAPSLSPQATPASAILPVGLTFENGTLTATGSVPSAEVAGQVIGALKQPGLWQVIDKLQINAELPPADRAWVTSLSGLAGAVPPDGTRVVAHFGGDRVIVRGTPATPGIERSILAAAAVTVGGPGLVTDGMDVP